VRWRASWSIDSEPPEQRRIVSMSEARHEHEPTVGPSTIEELARIQHAQPVAGPDDLVADIWESDEELDAFLADLRAARNASLA
jgi:hypothetical protein